MLRNIDQRDVAAGALLSATGAFVAVYAWLHYDIGSVSRMGPGMFPAVLGTLLAGLGILVMLPALFRTGTIPPARPRPFAAVVLATVAFALSVDAVGMVPAILVLTLLAALADEKLGFMRALAIAAVLSAFATLVFYYALGVQLRLVRWPF